VCFRLCGGAIGEAVFVEEVGENWNKAISVLYLMLVISIFVLALESMLAEE
jgi:hypothetical protein